MNHSLKSLHTSILFLVLFLTTQLSATIVGTTKGEFSVNQGTANYNLKIDVPPGVAGMEPKLSLNYSSSGGNGYMGIGWGIGGVSAITRCPQTKAVDGANHKFGVKYNSNDRFCLDGQRLINVSGDYGADGTEYRTEIDTYSKIVSRGSYGGGPRYFDVYTKSGLRYIYGANATTYEFTVRNKAMKLWKVDRIIDTYNNKISFSYSADYVNGIHRLNKVTYADNTIQYNYEPRVDVIKGYHGGYPFMIDKRLKEVIVKTGATEVRRYKVAYTNEASGAKRSKVSSITEHVAEGDLKKLSMAYGSQGSSSFANASLKISDYGYSAGGWRVGTHPRMMVDVDGDGLVDVVGFGNSGVSVSLNTGSSFKDATLWLASFGAHAGGWDGDQNLRMLSDVNGDGLVDVVGFGNSGVSVSLNTGHSFSTPTLWIGAYGLRTSDNTYIWSSGGAKCTEITSFNRRYCHTVYGWYTTRSERMLSDVNGDGLPDIVGFGEDGVYISLNTGHSFSAPVRRHTTFDYNSGWRTEKHLRMMEDMNGDGLPDIVGFGNGGFVVALNKGNGTFYGAKTVVATFGYDQGWRVKNHPRMLADTNGDGLLDVVGFGNDGVYIALNTGTSFKSVSKVYNGFGYATEDGINHISKTTTTYECEEAGPTNGWMGGSCRFITHTNTVKSGWDMKKHPRMMIDIDGNGLVDIVGFGEDGVHVSLNTGSSFKAETLYRSGYGYATGWRTENHPRMFSDVNGDGLVDIVGFGSAGVYVSKNNKKVSLLTRITNNTDQDIKIDYKHMTNSVIYHNYSTHGDRNKHAFNNIANDNIELTTSQSLVYSVNSANGVGGYNQIRYRYYGYVINKLRGSQGFHAIDTYDDTSRMKSVDFYTQISQPNGAGFQYTGMPFASYTGLEYGTAWSYWLTKTDIIYRDASTHSGSRAKIYEPYTFSNVQTIHEPGTTTPIKAVYHNNYLNTDGLGNINKTVDRTYDFVNKKNFYKTTYNEYKAEYQSRWHIGRLTKAKVVHSQTDGGTVTRSSTFKYNAKGVLSEEVANAGTSLALKKTYAYDAKGNKISETVSGANIITAQTRYDYGTQYGGKFLTHIDYADGTYQKIPTYDARFGTATSMIDANDLKTTWTYDGMGRKIKETRADGTWSRWEHLWYGTGDIKSRYVYWVKQTQSGTGYSTATYYDSLGRETSKHTSTLGAKRVLRYKHYNAKGELYAESLPYINGQDTRTYIRSYYDKYGRATKVTKPGPNGSTQTYSTYHKNFTSIVTDAKGIRKATVQNAIGQTIHITDAYGTSAASGIVYKYDAAGNLLSTTDAGGNVITMKYDAAGNKTYMKDPDLGVWNYRYFPTGKLWYQWSGTEGTAVSKQYTYKKYDILGRLVNTNTYDRPSYFSDKATYTYNYKSFKYGDASAAVGTRGKMIEAYASSRIGGNDYKREKKTMTYDSLGRPKSTNTYIYGRGDYLTSTTYDVYSRPSTITYPNGYKVKNVYDGVIGVLKSVVGTDTKGNVTNHYTINALTAFGEISDATFGNKVRTAIGHDSAGFVGSILSGQNGSYYSGNVQQVRYIYDALGNVLTRNDDSVTGKYIRDTFAYDAMNRLYAQNTDSNINGNYAKSKIYRYDKLGNMTHNYSYKGEHRSGGYLYGDHIGKYVYYVDKPHAVKSAGSRSYTYDDVGNMTNRNGDTITYNPLSKPAILKNGKNGKEVRFYYGVGGQRFMKTTAEKQTFYLGKAYEEEQKVGSKEVKSTVYITVGGKAVGTHVEVLDKTYVSSNAKYKSTYNRYFHADALGSITAITNDTGTVVERRSYEPFGKIRAMDYGTNNNTLANTVTQTARAFTGHEQIAELSGLIHMNARVYDSDIGRFLSADTVIQAPHDSQSYNRYSYVRNNPLMFTDPSGHSWFSKLWKKVKKYIRTIASIIVAAVIAIYAPEFLGAYIHSAFGVTVATGALAGFASGAIMTGSLGGALKGALFGAISAGVAYGVAEVAGKLSGLGSLEGHTATLLKSGLNKLTAIKTMLHGLSRGIISKLQGGSFKAGFMSGLSSAFDIGTKAFGTGAGGFTMRTAVMAIVGGTASALGGGKFSNGAVSGAFVHMFNAEARGWRARNALTQAGKGNALVNKLANQAASNLRARYQRLAEARLLASWGPKEATWIDNYGDEAGLVLSVGSVVSTGGLSAGFMVGAMIIDIEQGDGWGILAGLGALVPGKFSDAIDVGYGISQIIQ